MIHCKSLGLVGQIMKLVRNIVRKVVKHKTTELSFEIFLKLGQIQVEIKKSLKMCYQITTFRKHGFLIAHLATYLCFFTFQNICPGNFYLRFHVDRECLSSKTLNRIS